MSFHSGRVSFTRFRVSGHAPTVADATTLERLAEYAFRESPIGAPSEVETGWTAGEHLFDTQFTYEKNIFGASDVLLFAMRLDTNKVPAEVKQAYRQMQVQTLAAGNPSGFASKAQKREAAELADRQLHEELAAGKYRRSKLIPVLWDLASGMLFCAASGTTVAEQLALLMQRCFKLDIEPVSAGSLAGEVMQAEGHRRDFEDLRPSPFTPPPPQARVDHEDAAGPQDISIPTTPWAFASSNTRDFLGNEWLIWLWWKIETDEGMVDIVNTKGEKISYGLVFDKSLEMDCAWGAAGKQTLRGDGPTRLPEAAEALATGKWPRKVNLILADATEGLQWELALQGDRMAVSSAALPQVGDAETARQLTEARVILTRKLAEALDGLYRTFLEERTSSAWSGKRQSIRQWIRDRRRPRTAAAANASEPVVVDAEPQAV